MGPLQSQTSVSYTEPSKPVGWVTSCQTGCYFHSSIWRLYSSSEFQSMSMFSRESLGTYIPKIAPLHRPTSMLFFWNNISFIILISAALSMVDSWGVSSSLRTHIWSLLDDLAAWNCNNLSEKLKLAWFHALEVHSKTPGQHQVFRYCIYLKLSNWLVLHDNGTCVLGGFNYSSIPRVSLTDCSPLALGRLVNVLAVIYPSSHYVELTPQSFYL